MDIRKISEVIAILKKASYKAYLVGGSSRDLLLTRSFSDIDIATSAPMEFIQKTFKIENDDGISMGSIKISYKNLIMEITRFRMETYKENSIFPKIEKYVDDPSVDASRRDFTINAIYLDTTTNQVIDPFDGVKDLLSYKVKFIGVPEERIKEDPTRIFRGLRIASKLNFEIDRLTNEAFINNIKELDRISNNKYNREIEKTINDLGEIKAKALFGKYKIERR